MPISHGAEFILSHRDIFNEIYNRNLWGKGSGGGSRPENTIEYRKFLHNFLRTNQITSVVDIGCGDWQFSQFIDWTGIQYIGIDVLDVVLKNTQKFSRDGISFLNADVRVDPLPNADLVIVKDVIQHWSNADILDFLPLLAGFKHALITNGFHPQLVSLVNNDIPTGSFRPVDLRSPPFNVSGTYIHWLQFDEPKWIFHWRRT